MKRRARHAGEVLDDAHRVAEGAGDLLQLLAAEGASDDLLLVSLARAPPSGSPATLGNEVVVHLLHLAGLERLLGLEDVEVGGGDPHLALARGTSSAKRPSSSVEASSSGHVVAQHQRRHREPGCRARAMTVQLSRGQASWPASGERPLRLLGQARVRLRGREDEVVDVLDLHRRWGAVDLGGREAEALHRGDRGLVEAVAHAARAPRRRPPPPSRRWSRQLHRRGQPLALGLGRVLRRDELEQNRGLGQHGDVDAGVDLLPADDLLEPRAGRAKIHTSAMRRVDKASTRRLDQLGRGRTTRFIRNRSKRHRPPAGTGTAL